MGKAHARAEELEKHVEKLKTVIEEINKEKEVFKTQAKEAAKKTVELDAKVENVSCFFVYCARKLFYHHKYGLKFH